MVVWSVFENQKSFFNLYIYICFFGCKDISLIADDTVILMIDLEATKTFLYQSYVWLMQS